MKIKPENRFWIWIYGFTAFVMLVAMGVFGWLAWTSREEPGVGRVAGARPASVATSSLADEQYVALAAFDAPAYIPQPRAPKEFQAAMALYAKQDYPGAAAALRAASSANSPVSPLLHWSSTLIGFPPTPARSPSLCALANPPATFPSSSPEDCRKRSSASAPFSRMPASRVGPKLRGLSLHFFNTRHLRQRSFRRATFQPRPS